MNLWIVKKIILENKLRSIIPLLGIIIGVASIMGIFAISRGGEEAIKKDLASIAKNRIVLSGESGFTREDISLVERIPIVEYIFSPEAHIIGSVEGNRGEKVKIEGYTKKGIDGKELKLEGSKNIYGENVLIGKKEGEKIFSNSKDIIGKTFTLKINERERKTLRVIGVYEDEFESKLGMEGIYMDIDELQRLREDAPVKSIVVTYKDGEGIEEGTRYLISLLKRKNFGTNYFVLEGNSKYKRIEKLQKMVKGFLGAVGIIALIMGGLGVSNLLINVVREMTPSIGILRTMGLSSKGVLKIFLYQSIILTVVGGLIGIIFGILGSYMVGKLIGIPSVYEIFEILKIFITSVVMGIIFGSIPAWKASRMEIVRAMKV